MPSNNKKTCPLCGKKFEEFGNNPAPLGTLKDDGPCCNKCNTEKVLQVRIHQLSKSPEVALWFKEDGTISRVRPTNNNHFELFELQSAVMGLIEFYPKRFNDQVIIFNKEGRIIGLKENKMFKKYTGISLFGNVLLCPEKNSYDH